MRFARWASSVCSESRSPSRSVAEVATSPPCAWRSRNSRRVDQSIAITLEAGVGLGANPIFKFGSDEQQQRWLPDLCAGRALGAFGLTEPDAGSDAGGTRTRAVLDDATGEWVIDGEKAFITNSGTPITSIITVTALDRSW